MSKPYLFIATDIWKQKILHDTTILFNLDDIYILITTDIQLVEIKQYYLSSLIPNNMCDVTQEEETFEYLKNTNQYIYTMYQHFSSNISENITEVLYVLPEDIKKADNRIYEETYPLLIDDNKKDIISWERLLNSKYLELGIDLYLYTDSQAFMFQNNIHPYLQFEWKIYQKAFLRKYSPSQKPVIYVIAQAPLTKKINKKTPKYLKQRFSNLIYLLENDIKSSKVNMVDIEPTLIECQEIISILRAHISEEFIVIMKNKLHHIKLLINYKSKK